MRIGGRKGRNTNVRREKRRMIISSESRRRFRGVSRKERRGRRQRG